MIELFSNQFWIAILFILQFILVVFLFFLVKKINQLKTQPEAESSWQDQSPDSEIQSKHVSSVIEMLEPLLREARKTARQFDEQIKEKKRLIKELNEALDNRIIHINLLLSRAEVQQKKMLDRYNDVALNSERINSPVVDESNDMEFAQQNQILEMYEKDIDISVIAEKLGVPQGEVKMVVDLKKKFLEMEKHNP